MNGHYITKIVTFIALPSPSLKALADPYVYLKGFDRAGDLFLLDELNCFCVSFR